uniref:Uncharacterized protein n=1 Tax=Globodera rostochiensis TaxID=31243 RepID=A0A914GVR9_GLORO
MQRSIDAAIFLANSISEAESKICYSGGSKLQCIKSDLQHTQNQSISTQNQPHSVPMAIAAKVLVLLFFVLALAFLVEQTTAQWYGYPYYYGKREAGFMPQGAANGNAEGSAAGGGHAMFKF